MDTTTRTARLRGRRHAQPARVRSGFFVKQGDGAADFKPIAHLYKTQVYALAEYFGVPDDIGPRPPTTDTYPLRRRRKSSSSRFRTTRWTSAFGVETMMFPLKN